MYMLLSDRDPSTPFKVGPKYEQLGLVKYLPSLCEQDSCDVPINTKLYCLCNSHCPISRATHILNCYQFTLSSHRGHTEAGGPKAGRWSPSQLLYQMGMGFWRSRSTLGSVSE